MHKTAQLKLNINRCIVLGDWVDDHPAIIQLWFINSIYELNVVRSVDNEKHKMSLCQIIAILRHKF